MMLTRKLMRMSRNSTTRARRVRDAALLFMFTVRWWMQKNLYYSSMSPPNSIYISHDCYCYLLFEFPFAFAFAAAWTCWSSTCIWIWLDIDMVIRRSQLLPCLFHWRKTMSRRHIIGLVVGIVVVVDFIPYLPLKYS
jgi:hypothetical protein